MPPTGAEQCLHTGKCNVSSVRRTVGQNKRAKLMIKINHCESSLTERIFQLSAARIADSCCLFGESCVCMWVCAVSLQALSLTHEALLWRICAFIKETPLLFDSLMFFRVFPLMQYIWNSVGITDFLKSVQVKLKNSQQVEYLHD